MPDPAATRVARGFHEARLARLQPVLQRHVDSGAMPGLVALLARGDSLHVLALGRQAIGGATPMRRDTLFRIASMTKPVVAVAAMILVEECRVRLDDPVDALLPELARPRVLRTPSSPVSDTIAAKRAITLRDLLTLRCGFGLVLPSEGRWPIQQAMEDAGLTPGPVPPNVDPDDWLRRLGKLPLVHQPGERWLYHTGSDVLGILVARAAGMSLGEFMAERIFAPLSMRDTGFHVPPSELSRLPPAYFLERATLGLALPKDAPVEPPGAVPRLTAFEDARAQLWSQVPRFHSGGGGLVSTVDDYLAFCRMLLGKGRLGSERILSRASVELMTSDQLADAHREGARLMLPGGTSWGFGMGIVTRRNDLSATPGRFGWSGGYGTSAYSDPLEGFVGILMTQRMMDSPAPPPVFRDFWTSAYQALGD
jgi:CubicO group peptidase (beta-lactamase class C family)